MPYIPKYKVKKSHVWIEEIYIWLINVYPEKLEKLRDNLRNRGTIDKYGSRKYDEEYRVC